MKIAKSFILRHINSENDLYEDFALNSINRLNRNYFFFSSKKPPALFLVTLFHGK